MSWRGEKYRHSMAARSVKSVPKLPKFSPGFYGVNVAECTLDEWGELYNCNYSVDEMIELLKQAKQHGHTRIRLWSDEETIYIQAILSEEEIENLEESK